MSAELDAVLAEHRLSDNVYDLFISLGSTMEQAEAAASNRAVMKNFSTSAGGAVLKFQDKAVMRADNGASIKAYLKATRLDFLLPPEQPDPVTALAIPPETLAAAQRGNLTAKAAVYQIVHGSKSKSEEAASLATVEALIAGTADSKVADPNVIADDRTRRAARAADTDHANNPWSEKAWSITNQGKKIKEIGLEAAAGIAASAHSHIGATHPTKGH